MAPSGTVEPPKPPRRMSGKERRALRMEAENYVAQMLANNEPFLLAAFTLKPGGGVQLTYKTVEFPFSEFEQAANLFAELLTRLLANGGVSMIPDKPEAAEPEPTSSE